MSGLLRSIAALAAGCALCGAAPAAPADPGAPPDPQALLRGFITEEQVSALFDYLRNALIAAAEGREGPVPDFIRRELDRIDADVKLRGTLAGLLALKRLEAETKQFLKERSPQRERPQAVAPYQRT